MGAAPLQIEDDTAPVLELDAEAAADTAAPAEPDVSVAPAEKISLADMWAWLSVRIEHDQIAHRYWSEQGQVCTERQRRIAVQLAIANALAFLIDNEEGFRNYMRFQREQKARATQIKGMRR